MKTRVLIFTSFSLLLLWTVAAVAAPAQKERALKVGRKGEITLARPTKVGDIVLQPDTYVIQHRVSGANHFVRFVELKRVEAQSIEGNYTYTEQDKAGEVKCRVEPANGPAKDTAAYIVTDGAPRITKVTIKGEDVAHVF